MQLHLIPKRLKALFPGANGSNNKPWLVPWHFGEGEFAAGPISDDLFFQLDPRSPDQHGFVEPARSMPSSDYQAALATTKDSWVQEEWPEVPEVKK